MELKTQVKAEENTQQIIVTREFDISVSLLFKAYSEQELFEQWMGTKVIKFDCTPHGSYKIQTSDSNGNVVFGANGTFHEVITDQRITRTFEMENTPFPVQLEFLDFENLAPNKSKLTMHILFRTTEFRNQLLQIPFAQGLNLAHNRLQELLKSLK
jgi:uncharacterized protein YndB with AHSA1/START domain